jgi:hypothetical protein
VAHTQASNNNRADLKQDSHNSQTNPSAYLPASLTERSNSDDIGTLLRKPYVKNVNRSMNTGI